MICLVLKTVTEEVLVPKAPAKGEVYRIVGLKEEEREKQRQLLRSACINGKSESSEIWENNRCAVCMHCKKYRETRTIGAYIHVNGDKEKLLNEQTEHCTKYGHERIFCWNEWKSYKKQERVGNEEDWRDIV